MEEFALWYKIEEEVILEQEKRLKKCRDELFYSRKNTVSTLHQTYGRQRILDINKKYYICDSNICGGGLFN